jgi:anti-sigma B factor antagonist
VAAQPTTEIEIHSSSACIVTLRGEHDASSSAALTMALTLARGYSDVLVDLARCHFVDSSVINALLLAARRARERGGTLELVVPTDTTAVRRTLEIANVQMILPFHATRAEGVEQLERLAREPRTVAPLSIPEAARQQELVERRTRARTDVTVLRARVTDETATTQLSADHAPLDALDDLDHEQRAA